MQSIKICYINFVLNCKIKIRKGMKEEKETNLKEETKRPFCCFLRVENFSFPSKSNIAQKNQTALCGAKGRQHKSFLFSCAT